MSLKLCILPCAAGCRLSCICWIIQNLQKLLLLVLFGCLPSPEKRVILDHKQIVFAASCHLCIFHVLAAPKMFTTCQTKTTVFKKLYKICSSVTNTSSVITQMSFLKAHWQLVLSTHQGRRDSGGLVSWHICQTRMYIWATPWWKQLATCPHQLLAVR